MIKPCPWKNCGKALNRNCEVCDGQGKVFGVRESTFRSMMPNNLYDLERHGWQSLANTEKKSKLRYCIFPDKEIE